MLRTTKYTIDRAIPIPIPPSAPRRPVVTANGTASSVMMTVTKGTDIFRIREGAPSPGLRVEMGEREPCETVRALVEEMVMVDVALLASHPPIELAHRLGGEAADDAVQPVGFLICASEHELLHAKQ